jgi:hypothetical protein
VNESNTRRQKIPEYYVCKPSTKEWHQIPNPRTHYFTERVGMMVFRSELLCYKIVWFSQPKSLCIKYKSILYNVFYCEIFSSEKWAWKRLEDVLLLYYEFLSFETAVSACGTLNWITSNNEIFTFFVDIDSWTKYDLPFPLCNERNFKQMKLVEYSGRLAMLCMEESSTVVVGRLRHKNMDQETDYKHRSRSKHGTLYFSIKSWQFWNCTNEGFLEPTFLQL